MNNLDSWLAKLPSEYEPISDLTRQFALSGVDEDEGGVILAGHEPTRGPQAYAVALFPGLTSHAIQRYEALNELTIPATVKAFLGHVNGAFLCELSLYGIPPSMIDNPPMLSRSTRNPYDIATANHYWRAGFERVEPTEFYIGGRNVSWSGQIGYFIRDDGSIVSYPKRGTDFPITTWPSFEVWLNDELNRMMTHRPAFLEESEIEGRKADRRYFRQKLLPWNWYRWLR
ncbi:MAG: hypothetical protein AAFV59_18085 [Pseudomonadota bacterium]